MATNTIRSRIALDRTRQISPQIVEYLRERILALELEPGATLSRIALQQQFGLSQTPVRDALLKLEEEGFIMVHPQYATLISRINIDMARQSHFMRRAIESNTVQMLADRADKASVFDLRRTTERVTEQADKADYADFLLADRAFHHVIFEHADRLELWPTLRWHSGHIDRLRRLNLSGIGMERGVELHGKIIDGIDIGDPDAAADAMREHQSRTLAMLLCVQANYPDFIEIQ